MPESMHLRVTVRIGARGAMLLVLAALWTRLFAWPLVADRAGSAGVFYYTWPLDLRLTLWAATIILAALAAFAPPRHDWWGWVALVIMPTQRAVAWAWAGISGQVAPLTAADQGLLYVLLVAAVMTAAAMRPPSLEPSEAMEATGGEQ